MAGTNFTDIILLGGLAVGVYLFYTECVVGQKCGLPGGGGDTGGDTTTVPPADDTSADPTSGDDNTGGSTSGSQCGALCKAKDCSGYKKSCKTGCVNCCGSGPNSPKCNSSGGSSGAVNCSDGNSCQTRCTKGWCTSLKSCCKGFKCDKCSGGGSSSGASCKCKSGLKVARQSPCTCTTCGQLFCGKTCSSASNCPVCTGNNHRVCTGGRCGCAGGGSNTGGSSSGGSCTCKQGSKCQSYPAGSASCCTWRGRNGGCPSGMIGHPTGGGCNCIKGSSYTRSFYSGLPLNHGIFGQGGAISKQQAFRQTYQFPRSTYRRVVTVQNSSGRRVPRVEGVRRGYV